MTASWWYWHIDGVSLVELPYGWSWSISTEVFFYLVYAVVLYRISALRSLAVAVVALISFCLLAYVIVFLVIDNRDNWAPFAQGVVPNFIPATAEQFPNSFLRWLIYVSPYLRLLEFIAGVLTCQIYLLMRSNECHDFSWLARSARLGRRGMACGRINLQCDGADYHP